MSLKFFHIVFIAASTLLLMGFGIWSIQELEGSLSLVMGVGSFVLAFLLLFYGVKFLKKMKNLAIVLVLTTVFSHVDLVWACTSCFSGINASGSSQVEGLSKAVFLLIGVTGVVLASFVGFFIYLWRQSVEAKNNLLRG